MNSATSRDEICRLQIGEAIRCFVQLTGAVGLIGGVLRPAGEPWVYAEGTVEEGTERPPERRTIWQIGSITKTFTATLLARAVCRHQVRLDGELQPFVATPLPTYGTYNASVPIRFVDAATHSAGLPLDPRGVPPGGYSAQQMYEYLRLYALAVEPGTSWNYSNTGFGLLANVLQAVEGAPDYGALVASLKESAQLPLPDTRIDLDREQEGRRAVGYSAPGVQAELRTATWPAFDGSGALYSTLDDMLVWLAYNLGEWPSPERDLLALTQRVAFNNGVQPMGLAWEKGLFGVPGRPFWSKGGVTNGFASFIGLSHELKAGVVLLTNSAYAYPQTLGTTILQLLGAAEVP